MKKVLFLLLISAFAVNIFAQNSAPSRPPSSAAGNELGQYGVRIEPDKRLIVMMAALEAAGIESNLSRSGEDFRQKLKAETSGINPDLRRKMSGFLKLYKDRYPQASAAELTAPFISLAYAMGQVPDLTAPARSPDLPDDLLEVLDFAPFVSEFYRTTDFAARLPAYVRLYQAEGDKMRGSAGEMVKTLLDYVKTKPELSSFERVKSPIQDPKNKNKTIEVSKPVERERRFFIVPDLLASTGTINFRNIGDDYFVIVPPETNLPFSEARRAYLQFVLEPVVLKNVKDITPFRSGVKILLDERRKENPNISPDIFLAVLRSLVAAIDARETEFLRIQNYTDRARREIANAQGENAKRAVSAALEADKKIFADETALELSSAYERGAVLGFYFSEKLKGLENAGFDVTSSLPDMIASLDPAKEQNRLAENADARRRAVAAREERRKRAIAENLAGAESLKRKLELKSRLDDIEAATQKEIAKTGDAKNFEDVENRLKQLLNEFPNEASVYYALGRVASLSAREAFDETLRDRRLEDAKLHYGNAIRQANAATDPALIQLSYVAVGRIFEFYEQNAAALQAYQAALKSGSANAGAFSEAKAAIARLAASKNP